MSAVHLAYLRATGACPIDDPASVTKAAALVGRVPQRAGREVTLARHPEAPSPLDIDVVPAKLTDSALIALGLCIGAAWEDDKSHPYPGRPFTHDDLSLAAREMGLPAASWNHMLGALRHLLTQSMFVETNKDGTFSLGPAVAQWSEADIEVLRRNRAVFSVVAGGPS